MCMFVRGQDVIVRFGARVCVCVLAHKHATGSLCVHMAAAK